MSVPSQRFEPLVEDRWNLELHQRRPSIRQQDLRLISSESVPRVAQSRLARLDLAQVWAVAPDLGEDYESSRRKSPRYDHQECLPRIGLEQLTVSAFTFQPSVSSSSS